MSSNYENGEYVYSKVKQVIIKNRESDLFHKAFLRPIQIALKTRHTESDTKKPLDALPYGLKQVIKKDISFNQYVLKDFLPFKSVPQNQLNMQHITENNLDNLISLMKPTKSDAQIQLCVCICMYSQDKTMLRKTLSGVANNIAEFQKHGISSDEIAVAVIMDGIEKVDQTVVDFFSEMEKESNIFLQDDVQALTPYDLAKGQIDTGEVDEEQIININNFIFDPIELEDRKQRRFESRKKEYQEVKKMIGRIENFVKQKTLTYEELDPFLKPFFVRKAREVRKKQYAQDEMANNAHTDEQILKQYAENITKSKSIISDSLNQAKNYCLKYIETRDDLALLNPFRVEVSFESFTKKSRQADKRKGKYQALQQEYYKKPIKMNLFLITRYKNSGKLASHNWFFNGLCKQIKSQFAVLLDVGLVPDSKALFKMYQHMKADDTCGGVCGYMNLRIQRLEESDEQHIESLDCLTRLCLKLTDIQRAQQVEYHFAHLIDKPFESIFKFIHVLPGAFSAYRMKALMPDEKEDSKLMRSYFKALEDSAREVQTVKYSPCKVVLKVILPDFLYNCCYRSDFERNNDENLLYDSNVYLAEDRTLCMGIHQNGYDLEYLPDAHAWVDPIKNLHGLLGQRKRWINGSFFAFEKVKRTLEQSEKWDICLKLQIMYLNFMNMLAFISPALFMFTIHVAMFAFRDWLVFGFLSAVNFGNFANTEFFNSFVYVIDFIYVMLMFGFVFYSMHFTHRHKKFLPFIYGISTIMGIFAIIVLIVLFVDMITGVIETIKCFQNENNCELTFMSDNVIMRQRFFNALPGKQVTFAIYQWLVVGIIAMYIVPISIYAIFYCRCSFLIDVIFGAFSFAFYTPTYLNILNTFALCRIDDISWGTKGLDAAEDSKNKALKDSWRTIKIIYVAKFLFWNIIAAAALLILSDPFVIYGVNDSATDEDKYEDAVLQSYVRKFFMVFGLMAIIGSTFFIKIFLGMLYSIAYRCCISNRNKKETKNTPKPKKQGVDESFDRVKKFLHQDVKKSVYRMASDFRQSSQGDKNLSSSKNNLVYNLASFIMANNKLSKDKQVSRAKQKWNNSHSMRSQIQKKDKNKQNDHKKPIPQKKNDPRSPRRERRVNKMEEENVNSSSKLEQHQSGKNLVGDLAGDNNNNKKQESPVRRKKFGFF